MQHVVEDTYLPSKPRRRTKVKSLSRDAQQLSISLENFQSLYKQSALSENTNRQLQSILKNTATPITKIISLGLGSLFVTKGQGRRMKQLTILLALQENLRRVSGRPVEIYAQDPSFTRSDQAFLNSLGIKISRTTSGSSVGEAASLISPSTLVYSPFLTIEVYELLLVTPQTPVSHVFGDDFNALLNKWPRFSEERKQVERVVKAGLGNYRRRAISGEGFWVDEDESFPMALYEISNLRREDRIKAKI